MERSRIKRSKSLTLRREPWRVAEPPPMYVVDASVALKWFMVESDSAVALALRDRYRKRDLLLCAPYLLAYEFSHVVCRRFRGNDSAIDFALKEFDGMTFEMVPPTLALMQQSVRLAQQYRLSVYDAQYLSVGMNYGVPVLTADGVFHRHVNDSLRVMSLEEWEKAY